MRAEDFFPLGWLEKPFRRQPYPDMTYREALETAGVVFWNIDTDDAMLVRRELAEIETRLAFEHPKFRGRSLQPVRELNELWRGKVTTLLKWFQTSGGTA